MTPGAKYFSVCGLLATAALALSQEAESPAVRPHHATTMNRKQIGLVIHGGAGTILRNEMTPEKEQAYRASLEKALATGWKMLQGGRSSLDTVEAIVRQLEDDELFNAGKGADFTSAGTIELDASIMEGKTLKSGAVASVKHIKNPISLARMVMEKSPHVMLDCEGAEAFARQNGVEMVDQKYFFTQRRWDLLQNEKEKQKQGGTGGDRKIISEEASHGTVGAVALDQDGNMAAATSTGGTSNKLPGRIGDSPIIGAGTYADNTTCAVSCTGDGEYFIRAVVAHEVSAGVSHGMKLPEAAKAALDKAAKLGGTGGLIAIDKEANVALPFNTSGMYRGYVAPDGKFVVDIYK